MNGAGKPEDKLKAAWDKFHARVAAVRAKTTELLKTTDEAKRQAEIEKLRRNIGS